MSPDSTGRTSEVSAWASCFVFSLSTGVAWAEAILLQPVGLQAQVPHCLWLSTEDTYSGHILD